ncbi:uncharacterized protein LOC123685767 isoform X1 [Harmonia axyridis]|uniref:uncharacterized protein LOC123685767 isoform X1 n=1 Tax=Harmonia axyridis TaxID=115357 RepID=UPI001E279636|nr:uncharacterized protein LOC123685767 isoform X1 [Harmonia axyridis]
MGNKCFLCGLTYIVGGEVSVHRLPSNQLEREKWLQRISWNEPLLEKKVYYLCSNHFPEDCFRYMNLRKRLIPGSLPSPFEIKLEIPPTYSEGNRGIEEQDSTEFFSKKQSPLGFGTSTTFYSPSKCASSSSSNSENLGMSLIQGGLPSAIKMEIPEEIPLTYSEENRSIEKQDSTESDSKTQSPLRFGTSTTVNSPSKCASSSSSNTENLGNSLIQGDLPSDIKLEIKMEIPEEIPMTYSEENGSVEEQDYTEYLSDSNIQSPSKKKLGCDTPTTNDSEETLTSTSPACASCSSSNSSKKRFFSNPRYIGDYTPSHLENPMLREKYFWLTQRTLSDLRIKNKILANQVRRLKLSLKSKKLMENNRHILPVRDEMENAVNLTIAEPTKVVIFLNQ